jgi:glutaredoxin
MHSHTPSRSGTARVACLTLLLTLCAAAQAQTVYRIVGPDGKITFSDKPPATAQQGKVASTGTGAAAASSAGSLPFELRQVVGKYPVTLYTAADCAPCASGRTLLSSRGVPYAERTVSTQEDMDTLKRLANEVTVPLLTIGSQRIKGFSDAEWSQYLDAAGYPRTSILPPGFRNAPASPLVVLQKPSLAKTEENPEQRAAPASPSAPGPSNPAGIQF